MSVRGPVDTAENRDNDDAASVAQSLHEDFIGLIAIFDRQLAASRAAGEAESRISDARAAAERGLELSCELIEMLRSSN